MRSHFSIVCSLVPDTLRTDSRDDVKACNAKLVASISFALENSMSTKNNRQTTVMMLAVTLIASGCDRNDSQIVQLAQEADRRQAAQNEEMVRLNREVAQGMKQALKTQAANDEHLHIRQHTLDEQFQQLEAERRELFNNRQRESLLAPILWTFGTCLVCGLVLLFCWQLLIRLNREADEAAVSQILIDELLECGGATITSGPEASASRVPQTGAISLNPPAHLTEHSD